MKNLLIFWLAAIGLLLVMGACKIEKRLYQPGYHVEWKKAPSRKSNAEPAINKVQNNRINPVDVSDRDMVAYVQSEGEDLVVASVDDGVPESEIQQPLIDWQKKPKEKLDRNQDDCETIVLTDGRKLLVIVLEIAQSEIRYKKCDMPDGPTVIVDKADVDRVIYANGAEDIISGYSAPQPSSGERSDAREEEGGKKMEVLGLLSMIFGIIGLFIAGIPLGIAALILSIISLTKFANNPGRFGGKGMAIAGMILGIVAIIGALLFIASMAA